MNKLRFLSVLFLLLASVYALRFLKLTTDLEYFLPEGSGESQIDSEVLHALSQSELSRRIVLMVSAVEQRRAIAVAKDLKSELASLPVRLSSGAEVAEPLVAALVHHRYQFISNNPETELPRLFSAQGLSRAVGELKAALASPAAPLVRAGAVQDPLLLSRRALERFANLNTSQLQLVDGVLVTADGTQAVLFATSDAQAFDGHAQTELWSGLEAAFAKVRRRASGPVMIEASALSRFAVAAEKSMRADVTRVGSISSIAILLLLWLVFVRLRYLPILMLPLGVGFLVGTCACQLAFGHIHAMTFAFGSSLIGVCIDYPIHLVNHLVLRDGAKGEGSQSVLVALLLGCVTTVFGLGAMGWGGLPGLREIAVFGASGVFAAFLATVLWLPLAVNDKDEAPPRHRKLAAVFGQGLEVLLRRRVPAYVCLALAAGLCLVGLPYVRWEDDPSKLSVLDPYIEAEDARVRRAALGQEGSEFIVLISHASEQGSLVANDALAAKLDRLVSVGALRGYNSLHNVIWSEELQTRNLTSVKEYLTLERLRAALEHEGFASEAFEPFGENNVDLALPPLRLADLSKDAHSALVAPWFISLSGGRRGLLTRLSGVKDEAALKALVAGMPGARYVNVAEFRANAYSLFRSRMLLLLAVGMVAVGALLAAHYRRWRLVVCSFVPAVLAALSTVGLLALSGQPLNLMHVLGLLLVLGMGVDYGIFLVESLKGRAWLGGPALSISMACASTVLSFGLLALSASPALSAVGQMIGWGVVLSMVFAVASAAVFFRHPEGTPT
ncbi:MAG: hypothetical protein SFV15_20690 [Polyangiaceae bacterium]|nr:hypothetical protein [Polyangiaceae bacterium]